MRETEKCNHAPDPGHQNASYERAVLAVYRYAKQTAPLSARVEDNVAITRAWNEALNAHDIETIISCFDPTIEFHSTFAAISSAVYRGHDGMRRWFQDLEDAWGEDLHSEIEAIFDLGEDTLLVYYLLHGRGRQSGAEVALPAAAVVRTSDGLIVYLKAYAHREDAFRDLGLSETELEPISP